MKVLTAIILIGIAVSLPTEAIADSLELPISASGRLYDAQGDLVFESAFSGSTLNIHWRNVNFLNQRWAYRSIVEYDLSALPSDAIIESATLTITPSQFGTSEGNPDFDFYGYAGDGALTVTDATASDSLIDTIVIGNLSPLNLDITDYLQSLIVSDETYLGINMRSADEGKTFNTFDEEFSSSSAVLTVNYTLQSAALTVPTMPSLLLLTLAFIIVLLGSTHHRKTVGKQEK